MGEWKEINLGDVAEVQTGPFGSQLKNEQYIKGGTPVVTVEHIHDFRIVEFNYPSVTENDKERLSKYLLKSGDIIFTRVGSVDLSAYVKSNQDGWMFSSRMLRVRPNEEINPLFLSYFFRQKSFREHLLNIAVGATMPSINTEILKSVPISFPPLPEQKAIASVLSSLDDKIDLLHRQNKTLEQMAETLFRQWFVEEAKEEWEEGMLNEIMDINPTYSLSKGKIAQYLEMKNVSSNTFNPENWYEREFTSGMKFKNGDTLLARITPCLENGKTCHVSFLKENEVGWGSTEYIVMRMKNPFHPFISYLIAKNPDFRDYAITSMSGSSGRQRAQANVLKDYPVMIPTNEVVLQLNIQINPILQKLNNNASQIRTLVNLRDTLLPKLMSGEVTISNE